MALTRKVWLGVIECSAEHVSPASEWMNLSQTDSVDIFDSRSPFGPEDKSSKWRPAIGQFMVERKATAISTPALLRIVSPHASAIMPVLLPNRTGGPTHLDPFHILPIDERFDISLLCAFRVYGDSVDIHMPTSLEFNRAAPGVCPIRGNCKITVVCPFKNCVRSSLLNMLRATNSLGWILPT